MSSPRLVCGGMPLPVHDLPYGVACVPHSLGSICEVAAEAAGKYDLKVSFEFVAIVGIIVWRQHYNILPVVITLTTIYHTKLGEDSQGLSFGWLEGFAKSFEGDLDRTLARSGLG